VAGSCEYGDEPSGSGATELVKVSKKVKQSRYTPWRRFGGEEV
jgi:hypothetical protein